MQTRNRGVGLHSPTCTMFEYALKLILLSVSNNRPIYCPYRHTAFPPYSNTIKLKTGLDKTEVQPFAYSPSSSFTFLQISKRKKQMLIGSGFSSATSRRCHPVSRIMLQVLQVLVSIHVPSKYRAGIADTDTSDL